jgi:cytochrome b561
MPVRNTATQWGLVQKLFHWTIALLIIGTSIFILHVNDSTPWFKSTPEIFITYIHWHKALGLIALALVLGRLGWRLYGRVVPVTTPLTPFESKASHLAHLGLYLLMFLVPLSGWISSSAFGSPTKFFGLFVIPGIIEKNKEIVPYAYWTHFVLVWMLLALVAIHVAAALWHHFRKKDTVLRGMWFGGR